MDAASMNTTDLKLDSLQRIFNLMKQSERMVCNIEVSREMCEDAFVGNRGSVIDWIVGLTNHLPPEIRDSSIQIFDRYIQCSFTESRSVLGDEQLLTYAAAASIILSRKVHSQNDKPLMSDFPALQPDLLVEVQRWIVAKTALSMFPGCTPTAFLHYILDLCPSDMNTIIVRRAVDNVIAKFLCAAPQSMLYAPSTIAISALVYYCHLMGLDCRAWLQFVPEFCLSKVQSPFFQNPPQQFDYLDCDSCLVAISSVLEVKSRPLPSPTTVADDLEQLADGN